MGAILVRTVNLTGEGIRWLAMARLTEMFTGRDTRYFDLFEASARTAVTASELLQRFIDGIPDEVALAKEIRAVENEADRITHAITQHVGATFVTPLEREDILSLASALDDVIDLIDETADLILLYKVEAPMEEAIALCAILVEATHAIAKAMPQLRSFGDVHAYTVEVNRLENDGDRLSRQAIAGLFDGGIDPMVVIRWKDIFERLEEAIDSTERVANILEGIIIKNR
jgi:predicted phosphate transport protein (TIGR00153 family)